MNEVKKIPIESIRYRADQMEERMCDLEDRNIEIMHLKGEGEQRFI